MFFEDEETEDIGDLFTDVIFYRYIPLSQHFEETCPCG